MKKVIKFIRKNVLGILIVISLGINVILVSIGVKAAEIITANQVTYNDSTVQAELDSLFDAVDINERLGSTNISGIGEDGTITGAIKKNNNMIENLKDSFQEIGVPIHLSGGEQTIPNDSTISTNSITLSSGLYVIYASVRWESRSTNGYRNIGISRYENKITKSSGFCDVRNSVDTTYWTQELISFITVSSETTYYLNVYQNSGIDLATAYNSIDAYKLAEYHE